MEEPRLDYLIRDQDGGAPRTLDLLQAWGPPLRPPLRARIARLLIRIADWLYTPPEEPQPARFLTGEPRGEPGPGAEHGPLYC